MSLFLKKSVRIINLLNQIRLICSDDDTEKVVMGLNEFSSGIFSFINLNSLYHGYRDSDFASKLYESHHLLRDGVGVEIILRFLHGQSGFNLNGTELIPLYLKNNKHRKVILIGSSVENVSLACDNLISKGCSISGVIDGYVSFDMILSYIETVMVDDAIIILGCGTPLQEKLASTIFNRYSSRRLTIFNGGAIIDRFAGKVRVCPSIFKTIRLEWLYRLFNEPMRLFKRNIQGVFILLISVCFILSFKVRH